MVMRRNAVVILIGCVLVSAGCAHLPQQVAGAPLRPVDLTCEYRTNPLGIDTAVPRLSWVNEAVHPEARAKNQTAYQILVATSPETLDADTGDLWDSGKVSSSESIQVPYEGCPLGSRRRAYWKVRVWDEASRVSSWSEPALSLIHI